MIRQTIYFIALILLYISGNKIAAVILILHMINFELYMMNDLKRKERELQNKR